jgi:hypothetical protein
MTNVQHANVDAILKRQEIDRKYGEMEGNGTADLRLLLQWRDDCTHLYNVRQLATNTQRALTRDLPF